MGTIFLTLHITLLSTCFNRIQVCLFINVVLAYLRGFQNIFQEIRLILPNSQRINRGNYEMKALLQACRSNDVTDLVLVQEHRGVPGMSLFIWIISFPPTPLLHFSK